MFERLLLAIDDSPSSEVAAAFAGTLARRGGASVHVFVANEYQVAGAGLTLHTKDEATALVTSTVQQLRTAGVPASGSAVPTSSRQVARSIVAAAAAERADAIVLGSRRRRGLRRLFSAQVRERTIRATSLPVLTAPSPLEIPKALELSFNELIDAQLELALSNPLA